MEHCRGCAAARDRAELVPVVREVREVRERPPGRIARPARLPGRA